MDRTAIKINKYIKNLTVLLRHVSIIPLALKQKEIQCEERVDNYFSTYAIMDLELIDICQGGESAVLDREDCLFVHAQALVRPRRTQEG